MAYIYKKVIHGKPYYYLRVSKRIKNKIVVKDIAYLGSDVSKINSKLTKLPNIYKKEIKKTYHNIKRFIESEHYLNKVKKLKLRKNPYIEKESFEKIEAIKQHYNKHFLRLNEKTIKEVYHNFVIDFAFNTTSIEGNTITLEETNRLLKENLTPKNRTLREIHDVKNTEGVFFELLKKKKKMSHELTISIHDNLLENIDLRKGYRDHDIRVFKSHFKSSPASYVKTDMGILLKWFKRYENKLHPLVLAGIFHHKFERIHPFSDGNGRTGRMLMNYILMQKKYPPQIIRKSKRVDYLDTLSSCDKAGFNEIDPKYYKKLIKYLAQEMIFGYWNNFLV